MTRSKKISRLILLLGLPSLATPALAAGGFDGTYTGTQRETLSNNSAQCQNISRDNARLTVKDGMVKYKWAVPLEAAIGTDGSFKVQQQGQSVGRGGSNMVTLQGRVSDGKLEADVGSVNCAAHLSMTKN